VKSVSFFLKRFQRYGVLKNVQLFGPRLVCAQQISDGMWNRFDNAGVNDGGTETIVVVVVFKVSSISTNKRYQT